MSHHITSLHLSNFYGRHSNNFRVLSALFDTIDIDDYQEMTVKGAVVSYALPCSDGDLTPKCAFVAAMTVRKRITV
jgi:hypothetical protein